MEIFIGGGIFRRHVLESGLAYEKHTKLLNTRNIRTCGNEDMAIYSLYLQELPRASKVKYNFLKKNTLNHHLHVQFKFKRVIRKINFYCFCTERIHKNFHGKV